MTTHPSLLLLATRTAVLMVFGFSLFAKIRSRRDYHRFRSSLAVPGFLPTRLRAVAAAGLTLSEALIVVLLAIDTTASWGLLATALLAAVLTVGVFRSWRLDLHVPCLCFGAERETLGLTHLIRNLVLCGCATAAFATHPGTAVPLSELVTSGPGPAACCLALFSALLLIHWTSAFPSRE